MVCTSLRIKYFYKFRFFSFELNAIPLSFKSCFRTATAIFSQVSVSYVLFFHFFLSLGLLSISDLQKMALEALYKNSKYPSGGVIKKFAKLNNLDGVITKAKTYRRTY